MSFFKVGSDDEKKIREILNKKLEEVKNNLGIRHTMRLLISGFADSNDPSFCRFASCDTEYGSYKPENEFQAVVLHQRTLHWFESFDVKIPSNPFYIPKPREDLLKEEIEALREGIEKKERELEELS